jgi:hypothetical protein
MRCFEWKLILQVNQYLPVHAQVFSFFHGHFIAAINKIVQLKSQVSQQIDFHHLQNLPYIPYAQNKTPTMIRMMPPPAVMAIPPKLSIFILALPPIPKTAKMIPITTSIHPIIIGQ